MKEYSDDIKAALTVLRNDGIILYPTDTVWGIGCDATNVNAFRKIVSLKKRLEEKKFILLLDNENRLNSFVKDVPEQAWAWSHTEPVLWYALGTGLVTVAVALLLVRASPSLRRGREATA